MASKGFRVRGDSAFARKDTGMVYHMADVQGRMYWCDCARCFRLGGKEKYPAVLKGSKAYKLHKWPWSPKPKKVSEAMPEDGPAQAIG